MSTVEFVPNPPFSDDFEEELSQTPNRRDPYAERNHALLRSLATTYLENEPLVFADRSGRVAPFKATVADIRALLREENPDLGELVLESDEPETYFKELKASIDQKKSDGLLAVLSLDDRDLIWFEERNYSGTLMQISVGAWREHFRKYDWDAYSRDRRTGGWNLISTDPNFDPTFYEHTQNAFREEVPVETDPKELLQAQAWRREILSSFDSFIADCPKLLQILTRFEMNFPDGMQPLYGGVEKMRNVIANSTIADLLERGIPRITVSPLNDPDVIKKLRAFFENNPSFRQKQPFPLESGE
jgi:hypothetical protein